MRRPRLFRRVVLAAALAAAGPAGADFYEDALERFHARDLDGAIVQLKNALQENPANLSARILLGRTHLAGKQAEAAEAELRKALRDGADEALVLEPLGRAYLLQRKYNEVVADVTPGRRAPALESRIHSIRGRAHLGRLDFPRSQESFERAAELDPSAGEPELGLARLWIQKSDVEAARRHIARAQELAPGDPETWTVAGEIDRRAEAHEPALAAFDRALALDPEFEEARLRRALVLTALEREEAALADLVWLRERFPTQPLPAYLQARILKRAGHAADADIALATAASAIEAMSEEARRANPETLLLHGLLELERENLEEARRSLTRYLALDPYHAQARQSLAQLLLRAGAAPDAIAVLEPTARLAPSSVESRALLGAAYFATQSYRLAAETYAEAVELAPERMDLQLELARALNAQGDTAGAGARLETTYHAFERPPEVGILLARVYLEQQDYARAADLAGTLIESGHAGPEVHSLLGQAQLGRGDVGLAVASFHRAIEEDPESNEARLRLGDVLLGHGRREQAKAVFEEALARDGGALPALVGLARLALGGEAPDSARALIEKAAATVPERDLRRLPIARLFLDLGDPDAAHAVVRGLTEAHREDVGVLEVVGLTEAALGKIDLAAISFGRMVRVADGRLDVLYRAGGHLHRLGRLEDARFAYRSALAEKPDAVPVLAALGVLEAAAGYHDRALDLARQIEAERRTDPRAYTALAEIYRRIGRPRDSLEHYRRAHALAPQTATVIGLFRAYLGNQRGPEGLKVLSDWVNEHASDDRARRTLAETYLRLREPQRAVAHYEALVERNPRNAADLNGLAWTYTELADARAVKVALEAVEHKPDDASILDTAGWALVRSGDPTRALPYLRDAHARDASNPIVRFHLAVALEESGNRREALEHLRAVARHPLAYPEVMQARARVARLEAEPANRGSG